MFLTDNSLQAITKNKASLFQHILGTSAASFEGNCVTISPFQSVYEAHSLYISRAPAEKQLDNSEAEAICVKEIEFHFHISTEEDSA